MTYVIRKKAPESCDKCNSDIIGVTLNGWQCVNCGREFPAEVDLPPVKKPANWRDLNNYQRQAWYKENMATIKRDLEAGLDYTQMAERWSASQSTVTKWRQECALPVSTRQKKSRQEKPAASLPWQNLRLTAEPKVELPPFSFVVTNPLLAGFLEVLPPPGRRLSFDKREKITQLFGQILDLIYGGLQ